MVDEVRGMVADAVSKLLSVNDVFGADDVDIERVDCPEWGGHLFVRTISGAERDDFEMSIYDANERRKRQKGTGSSDRRVRQGNLRAMLVARCACNAEGTRIFKDSEVARLGEKSALVLDRLYDVAARLNGLTQADEDRLVEDFDGDPDGPSSSP